MKDINRASIRKRQVLQTQGKIMKNSTILIAIGKDAAVDELAESFEAIRALSAHAFILVIDDMPNYPYYTVGAPSGGAAGVSTGWIEERVTLAADLEAKATDVRELLQRHNVSGEVSTVFRESSMTAGATARRAMLCDMALINSDLRASAALFRRVLHGILFQSPVGVLLNDDAMSTLSGPKRIFVAWKAHLHSARAVHQALPMLRRADEVVVGTIDPVMTELRDGEDPGVDIAKWLTRHGCKVTVQQFPSGGQDIGDCILDRSSEIGADLIVMGSYGHSRARQAIFGGTTQSLIDQTEQAVFLAH
ncbi:universal stress protein [Rhodobacteraceae bacterium KMM 6894]|nr:universal stress protein [Rhodobacteraceae bacterium KMM 6894]